MKHELMAELIKTLRATPPENLAKLLRDHSPIASHCPACHTIWPCTLWSAGTAATRKPKAESAA